MMDFRYLYSRKFLFSIKNNNKKTEKKIRISVQNQM